MRHFLVLLAIVGLTATSYGQQLPKPTQEGLNELKDLTSALETQNLIRTTTDSVGNKVVEVTDAKRLQAYLKDHRNLLQPRVRETLIRTIHMDEDQEATFRSSLMKAIALEMEDRRLEAFALLSQGLLETQRENFAPALRAFEQAGEAFAAIKDHGEWQAACLGQRGIIYELQQRRDLALKEFRAALPLYKASLGERDSAVAACLQSIGTILGDLKKPDEAMKALEQAADILSGLKDDPKAGLSNVYTSMAYLHYQARRYPQAQDLFEKALRNRIKHLGENHTETAKAYDNLGEFFTELGDYENALNNLKNGQKILARMDRKAPLDLAINLSITATVYERLAEHQKVLDLQLQALAIFRRVLSDKHLRVSYTLGAISSSYAQCGEYGKCLEYAEESLKVRQAVAGERHESVVVGLSRVGFAYSRLQNYGKAGEYYSRALRLAEQLPNCPPFEIGAQHNNLGFVYSRLGEPEKAIREFRASRRIMEKDGPPDNISLPTVDINIAMEMVKQKEYAPALALLKEGLAGFERRFGPRHPEVARAFYNIAAVHFEEGNQAEALRALDKAQAALRTVPSQGSDKGGLTPLGEIREIPLTLNVLGLRGHILDKSLRPDSPVSAVRECLHNYEFLTDLAERMRRRGIETQTAKLALGEQVADSYPRLAVLYQRMFELEKKPEHLTAAFRTAELGTARVFLEAYGQSRALDLGNVSPELREQEAILLANLRRVEGLLRGEQSKSLDLRDADKIGRLQKDHETLQEKLSAHLARVERAFPKYAALKYPRPSSLEEAQNCLAPNEAALVFLLGTKGSSVLLIEGKNVQNPVAIHELPPQDQLAEQVSAITNLAGLGSTGTTRELGSELFATLLAPFADRIKGKDLVIVPTGALCYLPFELLVEPVDKGAPPFLIERHRIRYAPSLSALHLQRQGDKARVVPDRALFAVGDPVYDRDDIRGVGKVPTPVANLTRSGAYAMREGRPDRFPRLPHSLYEVEEIGKLFTSPPAEILTGLRASKSEVKRASASDHLLRYRYLHFATHGILGLDSGQQPALVLSLVGDRNEDGFLQMDEVANLKLNADLVVLSACRSGQGWLYNGEGVKGLARAFLQAGSRVVLCSLWQVEDRETAHLMVSFYHKLKAGQLPADALQATQVDMIHQGKAPRFWAPFVLIGE